jgi:hypothetical protein
MIFFLVRWRQAFKIIWFHKEIKIVQQKPEYHLELLPMVAGSSLLKERSIPIMKLFLIFAKFTRCKFELYSSNF